MELNEKRISAYTDAEKYAKQIIHMMNSDKYLKLSADTNDKLCDLLINSQWQKSTKIPPNSSIPYDVLCVSEVDGNYKMILTEAWVRDMTFTFCASEMKQILRQSNILYWKAKQKLPDRKDAIIDYYKKMKDAE